MVPPALRMEHGPAGTPSAGLARTHETKGRALQAAQRERERLVRQEAAAGLTGTHGLQREEAATSNALPSARRVALSARRRKESPRCGVAELQPFFTFLRCAHRTHPADILG